MPNRRNIHCRQITEDIFESVADCLTRGFPDAPPGYWTKALRRMAARPPISPYPRYGYALEAEGKIVGAILVIYSWRDASEGGSVRCNLSSWCVDKEYRAYASTLHMMAVKFKEVTYLNISPAEHTWPVIEAVGFSRYSDGQLFFAPLLSAPQPSARARAFHPDDPASTLLSKSERQILTDHASLGCRALICVKAGAAIPFIFQDRAVLRQTISCPHLIYCRSLGELAACANSIGRYLLFRTGPFCVVDANGPVDGLVGWRLKDRFPRYFNGPDPPRVGDLSYTELVLLGPSSGRSPSWT